jgi:hypothetical protein
MLIAKARRRYRFGGASRNGAIARVRSASRWRRLLFFSCRRSAGTRSTARISARWEEGCQIGGKTRGVTVRVCSAARELSDQPFTVIAGSKIIERARDVAIRAGRGLKSLRTKSRTP